MQAVELNNKLLKDALEIVAYHRVIPSLKLKTELRTDSKTLRKIIKSLEDKNEIKVKNGDDLTEQYLVIK